MKQEAIPALAAAQEPEAKSETRQRRIPAHLWVTASAWGSRLVNMAVQLVSMRLLLAGMGADHYAAYALLNSLFAWYQLADLRIGDSLQNYISEHRAEGRSYDPYFRISLLTGGVLLLVSLSLSCLAAPLIGPLLLRHFSFLSVATQKYAFLIVGLFFAVTAVAGMGMKAWYALQKGYVANLLTLAASLGTLAGTWAAQQAGDLSHRLLWSLAALSAPPAAAACASVWWLLAHEKPGKERVPGIFRPFLSRGFRFWLSLLLGMLLLKIDYIIIAQILPTSDMVVYNILDRIFGAAYTLYLAATQALWPVAAELIVQEKWERLFAQIRSHLVFGIIFVLLVMFVLMAAARPISHLLSPHEDIFIPPILIGLFGLFYLVNVWTITYATVVYSKSDLTPFLVCGAVQALVGLPLQWFLAAHFGLNGIMIGLTVIYLSTMAWVLPARVHSYAGKLKKSPSHAETASKR